MLEYGAINATEVVPGSEVRQRWRLPTAEQPGNATLCPPCPRSRCICLCRQLLSLYTEAKEAGEIVEEEGNDGWETASDSDDRSVS